MLETLTRVAYGGSAGGGRVARTKRRSALRRGGCTAAAALCSRFAGARRTHTARQGGACITTAETVALCEMARDALCVAGPLARLMASKCRRRAPQDTRDGPSRTAELLGMLCDVRTGYAVTACTWIIRRILLHVGSPEVRRRPSRLKITRAGLAHSSVREASSGCPEGSVRPTGERCSC